MLLTLNTVNALKFQTLYSIPFLPKLLFMQLFLNPCPAEPGYTLPLQTV